jgi:hypothetical protein
MANDQRIFGIHDIQETMDDLVKRRPFRVEAETATVAAARLVWLVAIAGAALLNAPALISTLAARAPSPTEKLLLVFPWALSALFGVLAHWFFGLVDYHVLHFYRLKKGELASLKRSRATTASIDDISQILEDRTTQLAKKRRTVEIHIRLASTFEFLTLLLLVAAFLL